MKAQSVLIDSFDTITMLKKIADSTCDELELFILVDIYNTYGKETVARALTRYVVGTDEMPHLAGRQVYTEHGYIDVLTCLPVHNSSSYACTFSHNPDEVYLLDKNGYCHNLRIWHVKDKPNTKPVKTRGRPKKDKSTKPSPTFSVDTLTKTVDSPFLMTESDFPLPEKRK